MSRSSVAASLGLRRPGRRPLPAARPGSGPGPDARRGRGQAAEGPQGRHHPPGQIRAAPLFPDRLGAPPREGRALPAEARPHALGIQGPPGQGLPLQGRASSRCTCPRRSS
ncbi:MAG: hypothetical protein MZV63_64795 [Marinilabiliales bacterium]|nr:hypothetical protein [Marinilabiliales bacterium]